MLESALANKEAHPTACEDGDFGGGWAHSIELGLIAYDRLCSGEVD